MKILDKFFKGCFAIWAISCVCVFAVIGCFFAVKGIYTEFFVQESPENMDLKADGFTIENYNVVLDVHEDNKVDVTENIVVNWYESKHHGIYKFTPEWLNYTGKDGKTIKRKSIITNYIAVDEQYSVDKVKSKPRIKIGSPNITLPTGDKEYIIKYTYNMGKDPFKGFDEFIFHAFGDYWGTRISNASLEIHLPKGIETETINFFADKYRKDNINKFINYTVSGNKIIASLSDDYPLYKSLTVDIELPEGYFVGGSNNYGYGSLAIILAVIGITVWVYLIWDKYGKDYEKRSRTVEFYPPENLNSAEIGYIFGNRNYKKLTISLLISLAAKGYIKINENDDKEIEIINFMEIPKIKNYENIFGKIKKREIEVKRLKKSDDTLNSEENTMMKYLFRKNDTKKINANIDKFLKVRDSLVNKGYIKIISDNNDERLHEIRSTKKIKDLLTNEGYDVDSLSEKEIEDIIKHKYEHINSEYYKQLEIYNTERAKLEALSEIEDEIYSKLFENESNVILSKHKTFYTVFSKVKKSVEDELKYKIKDKVASSKIKFAILASFISLILSMVAYRYVEDLNPMFSFMYYVSFGCIFVDIFFAFIMKRKTEYGEIIRARVFGFRDFLVRVEKDDLEALVEKDPKYFYNILPYTYVLNVSKKWIKKFEDIPIPEVDMGTIDYSSGSDVFSISNHVYYPTPSYSSSSSGGGGCSSCGGGCSSCGGGCSSCGGGGSW